MACLLLILGAKKVRDRLVLGLLVGALVALVSLSEHMFLYPVDSFYARISIRQV